MMLSFFVTDEQTNVHFDFRPFDFVLQAEQLPSFQTTI